MTHQDEIYYLEKHLQEIESERQSILNRLKELRAMITQSRLPSLYLQGLIDLSIQLFLSIFPIHIIFIGLTKLSL